MTQTNADYMALMQALERVSVKPLRMNASGRRWPDATITCEACNATTMVGGDERWTLAHRRDNDSLIPVLLRNDGWTFDAGVGGGAFCPNNAGRVIESDVRAEQPAQPLSDDRRGV